MLLQPRAWQINDAGEWLSLSYHFCRSGPDIGYQESTTQQTSERSQPECNELRQRGCLWEKKPSDGSGRLLTLVSKEADNCSQTRQRGVYTHGVRQGLEMKMVGTKPGSRLQGMLGRDTTFGLPVSAGLGVDPEMAHSYWQSACLVQWLSKWCEVIWQTLPICYRYDCHTGGNTHCLLPVPYESLCYHLLKGDTKKVEGKCVL